MNTKQFTPQKATTEKTIEISKELRWLTFGWAAAACVACLYGLIAQGNDRLLNSFSNDLLIACAFITACFAIRSNRLTKRKIPFCSEICGYIEVFSLLTPSILCVALFIGLRESVSVISIAMLILGFGIAICIGIISRLLANQKKLMTENAALRQERGRARNEAEENAQMNNAYKITFAEAIDMCSGREAVSGRDLEDFLLTQPSVIRKSITKRRRSQAKARKTAARS